MPLTPHATVLFELPAGVRRGTLPDEEKPRLSCGNPDVDRLLGGGFPRGRLSEVTGEVSSGRTSLALSLVGSLRGGEMAALVDPSDRFDPDGVDAAGLDLSRLLWVRPPGARPALSASELLLATGGLGLVILDLADLGNVVASPRWAFAWPRLARRAAGSEAVLLLLSSRRLSGSAAHLCLSLARGRARWSRHRLGPRLLDGLAASARIERLRAGMPGERFPLVAGG